MLSALCWAHYAERTMLSALCWAHYAERTMLSTLWWAHSTLLDECTTYEEWRQFFLVGLVGSNKIVGIKRKTRILSVVQKHKKGDVCKCSSGTTILQQCRDWYLGFCRSYRHARIMVKYFQFHYYCTCHTKKGARIEAFLLHFFSHCKNW